MPRPADPSLQIINLRLRKADIAQARREAAKRAIPYQHVIREWVRQAAGRRQG